MFCKHEAVGGFWVLTDLTPDAGWESLICESKKSGSPNYAKARWDLSRRYATEQDAIIGHGELVKALQAAA